MNLTPAEIDRIVAEVVRRLRILMASSSTPAPAKFTSNEPHRHELQRNELHLDEKLITLRTLKDRLEGISKVIVADRAVITPAVKDELRQRKIAWERATTKARS
ncbi:hypothetical protein NA78x_004806 [Anatilimnocola sp. NA78]|uniref:hypothetical protein n=1 Tax=Anatilimnocola sp. NA78 TaxID=3415683 RepID=UPI003CE4C4F1